MACDFPASPTVGQTFTPSGGPTYIWNGYAWDVIPVAGASLIAIKTITASGTYTPSPGLAYAIVECVGGGGAGSGCEAVMAPNRRRT